MQAINLHHQTMSGASDPNLAGDKLRNIVKAAYQAGKADAIAESKVIGSIEFKEVGKRKSSSSHAHGHKPKLASL